jgi:hypothetical protein
MAVNRGAVACLSTISFMSFVVWVATLSVYSVTPKSPNNSSSNNSSGVWENRLCSVQNVTLQERDLYYSQYSQVSWCFEVASQTESESAASACETLVPWTTATNVCRLTYDALSMSSTNTNTNTTHVVNCTFNGETPRSSPPPQPKPLPQPPIAILVVMIISLLAWVIPAFILLAYATRWCLFGQHGHVRRDAVYREHTDSLKRPFTVQHVQDVRFVRQTNGG